MTDKVRHILNYKLKELQELQEEDFEAEITKDYGIGVDCHRDFIYVCVLIKRGTKARPVFKEFPTDWTNLLKAKDWCLEQLREFANPPIDFTQPFHYTLESTAQYHVPITLSWKGTYTLINPKLVGNSKRKTDRLDARYLAHSDLNGNYEEFYVPSLEIRELRMLMRERHQYVKDATRSANRINNSLLGFGYTIGKEGSVARKKSVRSIVEEQIAEIPKLNEELCPIEIPPDARQLLRERYQLYDSLKAKSVLIEEQIHSKILSMQWETGIGSLGGKEMLNLLMTAPQVGDITAMTFLAYIITPKRFHSSKALAAYCGLDPSLKISAGKSRTTEKRGGHKALHTTLTMCASNLMRHHKEMFGRWGFNLYSKCHKWKKATNAVARKLACALYFMWLTEQPFSYDKYRIAREIETFDIPIEELALLNRSFTRYIKYLHAANIFTTQQMANSYLSCGLQKIAGLGPKFFSITSDFFDNQHDYRKKYAELTGVIIGDDNDEQ